MAKKNLRRENIANFIIESARPSDERMSIAGIFIEQTANNFLQVISNNSVFPPILSIYARGK